MIHYKSFIVTVLLIVCGVMPTSAKEVVATLHSEAGDKVTVKYDVTYRNGDVFLTFVDVRKQLADDHIRKYRESDRVKAVFFDKNGGYDTKFLSDIETEAIVVASDEIQYTWSDEGYVWVDEQPELQLKLLVPKAVLSIPIYLVYYKRSNTYNVFSYCGVLEIPLTQLGKTDTQAATSIGSTTSATDMSGELERNAEQTDDELALLLVDKINDLLDYSSDISLPEGLDTYTGQLRQLELTISDRDIKRRVGTVLRKVEEKKEEVARVTSELQRREEEDAARKAQEAGVKQDLSYLTERLDNADNLTDNDIAEMKTVANELRRQSHAVENGNLATQMREAADRCDAEVKKREDKKKRRNIGMIIGGVILSVLMAVGNQTMQHFRNLRNQKGIEDMQDKIVRRAESEAKRRAQSMVRSKVSRVENAARQKGRDLVRNSVNDGVKNLTKKKGNNSYTI